MLTPVSYEDAVTWLDRSAEVLGSADIPVHEAAGRVLTAPVVAPRDCPPSPLAAVDGYAVKAGATVGASDYNPLSFAIGQAGAVPGGAAAAASGDTLPDWADAVIPVYDVDVRGSSIDVYTPIAAGENVIPAAREAGGGDHVMAPWRVLRPADAAWLAVLGLSSVPVARRPEVRVIAARHDMPDAGGAMVRHLVERDGAVCQVQQSADTPLSDQLAGRGEDMLIVVGGSGLGANDLSVSALEATGEVIFHGVAINPGETVAAGWLDGRMVVVLPGPPLATLFAYDALAGRVVRRLGGRPPEWPYAVRSASLVHKIASRLGLLECCRVRLTGDGAEPVAVFDNRTLSTAVRADGFVLVPASSEGFAEGDSVSVYLYDQRY